MFLANKLNKGAGFSAPDAQFNYVTMLLHGNGTSGAQNNTFLDSGPNTFTITRNGNTTQGSFSPYGSNWSNVFDGSSSLNVAYNSAFNYSSSIPFTIDFWFYPTVGGVDTAHIASCSSGTGDSTLNWLIRQKANNTLRFVTIMGGAIPNDSTNTFNLNQWNHAAIVMTGSAIKLWLNGVYQGSVSCNGSQQVNGAIKIGSWQSNYTGYVSNFRYTNTQVYTGTSNITVPTAPLTAVTGTQLLTCQSNRFVDNSTNNFTFTITGTPSVQRFNPFGTSTAYSTSVIGGSGYFDGAGDYLTVTEQTYSGNFTIECWFYQTAASSSYPLLFASANAAVQIMVDYQSNGKLTFYSEGSGIQSASGVFQRNQWNHLAYVRSGSTVTIYYNGTSVASGSRSDPVPIRFLCGYSSDSNVLNGYTSDVRITTSAVYTTTFTPPTAPLTAISGTSILLNFTNGAIFDNAMMNDLETVGNAQISTSVKKYGTGSIKFDGTDDRLTAPSSPNLSTGTGDFTIEGWSYNAGDTHAGLFQISTTAGGLSTSLTNTLAVGMRKSPVEWQVYAKGTATDSSGQSWTANTWYHFAIVRSSGTTKLYVNGTAIITVSSDTTDYTCSNICVGGYYSTSYLLNGYIDDLRITKGYARYTANFTAPTAALPDLGPY